MGAVATRAFADVFSGGVEEGSPWAQRGHGPALRRLFGRYSNPELWSVYRKVQRIDKDGTGHLTIEEAMEALDLKEHHVLFIWDLFSQQNSLLDASVFLAMVCAFSSARLDEKGRFLLSLFDTSRTGIVTGAEVGKMCLTVLRIFGRCTGSVVRDKDISSGLQQDLPDLLPELREAASRTGMEAAFKAERLISRMELEDSLLPSVQVQYGELPVAGPAPDWGLEPPMAKLESVDFSTTTQGLEPGASQLDAGLSTLSSGTWDMQSQPLPSVSRPEPGGTGFQGARALGSGRPAAGGARRHENTMEVMNGLVGEEFLPPGAAPAVPGTAQQLEPPEHVWFVIHAADYDLLSRDLPSFRHIVTRSISTSLGVPISCVEMLDLNAGARGGSVVALALRGGRGRGAGELRRELGQQLRSTSSALRRGRLAEYLTSAEMFLSRPSHSPTGAEGDPRPAQVAHTYAVDRGAQARDQATALIEVVAKMRLEQARLEAAEAEHQSALSELQARDAVVAQLREELARRERLREAEEERLREERAAQERLREEARLREEQAAQERLREEQAAQERLREEARLREEQAAQAEASAEEPEKRNSRSSCSSWHQLALVGEAEAFVQAVALGSVEALAQEGLSSARTMAGHPPMSARPVQVLPHPEDTPRSDA